MNKFLLSLLFAAIVNTGFSQDTTTVISQTDLGANWYSGSTAGGGQSFTIENEGKLTAFSFSTAQPEGITIVQLREGQDVNGTLLFTDTVDVQSGGWFTVNFPSISVCPGVYCVLLNDFQWGASNLSDPYPGGSAIFGGGWVPVMDMAFEVEQIISNTPPVPDEATLSDVLSSCVVYPEDLIYPSATDFCSQNVTITHDAIFPMASDTTIVTWTFDDGNGGIGTHTQRIIIVADTLPPVADQIPDLVFSCPVTELLEPYAYDCSWPVSASNDAVFPLTADTTVVTWTFTDAYGNTSTLEHKVMVTPFELNVMLSGNTLSVEEEENTFYQWINCADDEYIENATSPSLDITGMTGSFALKAYRDIGLGCGTQSECVSVGFLALETFSSDDVKVYPNPAANELNIETDGIANAIRLTDLQGRIVLSENLSGKMTQLNIADLKSGTYMVQIVSASGREIITRFQKL